MSQTRLALYKLLILEEDRLKEEIDKFERLEQEVGMSKDDLKVYNELSKEHRSVEKQIEKIEREILFITQL